MRLGSRFFRSLCLIGTSGVSLVVIPLAGARTLISANRKISCHRQRELAHCAYKNRFVCAIVSRPFANFLVPLICTVDKSPSPCSLRTPELPSSPVLPTCLVTLHILKALVRIYLLAPEKSHPYRVRYNGPRFLDGSPTCARTHFSRTFLRTPISSTTRRTRNTGIVVPSRLYRTQLAPRTRMAPTFRNLLNPSLGPTTSDILKRLFRRLARRERRRYRIPIA